MRTLALLLVLALLMGCTNYRRLCSSHQHQDQVLGELLRSYSKQGEKDTRLIQNLLGTESPETIKDVLLRVIEATGGKSEYGMMHYEIIGIVYMYDLEHNTRHSVPVLVAFLQDAGISYRNNRLFAAVFLNRLAEAGLVDPDPQVIAVLEQCLSDTQEGVRMSAQKTLKVMRDGHRKAKRNSAGEDGHATP